MERQTDSGGHWDRRLVTSMLMENIEQLDRLERTIASLDAAEQGRELTLRRCHPGGGALAELHHLIGVTVAEVLARTGSAPSTTADNGREVLAAVQANLVVVMETLARLMLKASPQLPGSDGDLEDIVSRAVQALDEFSAAPAACRR